MQPPPAYVPDLVSFLIVAKATPGGTQRHIDRVVEKLRVALHSKRACYLIQIESAGQVPDQVNLRVLSSERAYATLKADVDGARKAADMPQTRSMPQSERVPDMTVFIKAAGVRLFSSGRGYGARVYLRSTGTPRLERRTLCAPPSFRTRSVESEGKHIPDHERRTAPTPAQLGRVG